MRFVFAMMMVLVLLAPVSGRAAESGAAWSAVRHGLSAMPLEPWRDGTSDKSFAAYVADTRAGLDAARTAVEPDAAKRAAQVELVAPRQWPLAEECGGTAKDGVLLIHGLSDSPFLMKDLGDALARLPGKCLLVRSILLPGHGTLPGDLVRPTAAQWKAAVRYGTDSFAGQVGRVHLVGFSTGATLALDLVLNGAPTAPPVASLILLSPSIGLTNRFPLHRIPFGFELFQAIMTAASGFGPEGHWLRIDEDQDFAKAESFPVMAPRPLMEVMTEVETSTRPLTLPVLMAFAAEDVTVDSLASLDFFHARVSNPDSRVLLYVAPATLAAQPDLYAARERRDHRIVCLHGLGGDDVGCAPARSPAAVTCPFGDQAGTCITALSHIGIPISPTNPHYGATGDYRNCLAYSSRKDWPRFCGCVTAEQRAGSALCRGVLPASGPVRLGEPTKDDIATNGPLTARLGYNPLFDRLVDKVADFLK
ncbi:alpha/beta hydrolase [Magnetospirillum fulvum]|uniref:Lysophospholipase, alpha-beta hydrolase superfamily n=1 Tax=Magnetospirillum fulvum TaxID=1082 RepID=A0A1H6HF75_MAGFU|nr:alpha/beta fold hydrolase [Magnetospirillum fulvum]SEH34421.1 Lysophospholipase, alpha-beta hydrolase superfamily [Magnetospirillum fulvum]